MALVPAHVTFVDATVIDAGDFNDNFTTFKDFLEGGNMDTDNLATKWAVYRLHFTFQRYFTPLAGVTAQLSSCTVLPATVELDKLLKATVTLAHRTAGSVSLDILQGSPGTYDGDGGSAGATTILSGAAALAVAGTASAPGFAVASVPAGQEVIFELDLTGYSGNFIATCELWCATKLKAL